jgi:ATP-dependent DNA helicase 2 subunit 2
VRHYTFAPLDKVITMKGKVLCKHRNLPTEEQDEAMSDYVDSLNLKTYRPDDEGYISMVFLFISSWPPREEIFSPVLHRINQIIGYRAIHPNKPLPPPTEILVKYSNPPEDLIKGSEKVRTKLIEAFNVKKGTSPRGVV